MPETPVSLLERLRVCPDEPSWQRLTGLYTPWIRDWLRRQGVHPVDADDLVQEVMVVLVKELPNFHHDLRRGAFRRWLRSVTLNRLRVFWRERNRQPSPPALDSLLTELEDPESGLSRAWDREHNEHVVRRLLELLEPEFEPSTWRAFRRVVLDGKATADAAAELGLSAVAVRIAKSRVLSRFRREVDGLLD
jgi:RNA polymerase sigma-70 factor (ECF subfamily)